MSRYTLLITLSMAITIAVSGCVKTGETKSSQYAVQGCATAGLGAGVTTFIKNRDDANAKEKAAISSMLGCMAGSVAGYQVGKRTDEYADAQSAANAEITRSQKHTNELKQYNAQLAQNIEDYKGEVGKIKEANLSAQEKTDNLKKTKEIVAKQHTQAAQSLKNMDDELNSVKMYYDTNQGSVAAQDKTAWKDQIASLEQEKLILSKHVSTLNALDASI